MDVRPRMHRLATAASALVLAAWIAPSATAVAEDRDGDAVDVTDTETVQIYTDASGEPSDTRVYEQVVLQGNGRATFANPVETDGLRNLDEFGGIELDGNRQMVDTTVDGEKRYRMVSNFDGELPLDLDIRYYLDGERVSPGSVVGEDGTLRVEFHVANTTSQMRDIEVTDGAGGMVKRRVETVVPMVASLETTLPSSYTDVTSESANLAGDGRGGTIANFTMTLFPPIGDSTATVGYTAQVSDGVVPDASMTALPVDPLQSPTFKRGAASYQSGAESGVELADGATKIDTNLLRLRDGATRLSRGLDKLYAGSILLRTGLQDRAVPGSDRLHDGTVELVDGTGRLDDGAGRLVDGIFRLDDGAGQLDAGAARLDTGAAQLDAGAGRLDAGAAELDAGAAQLDDGAGRLDDGAAQLDAGAADLDDGALKLYHGLLTAQEEAPRLLKGLKLVRDGLDDVDGGLTQLYDKVGAARPQFAEGLDELRAGIGTRTEPDTLIGGLEQIRDGLEPAVQDLPCAIGFMRDMAGAGDHAPQRCYDENPGTQVGLTPSLNPVNVQALQTLAEKTRELRLGLIDVRAGSKQLQCGLDATLYGNCAALTGTDTGVLQGVDQLDGGIEQLISGVQDGVGRPDDTADDQTLRGGMNALQDGADELVAGGGDLLDGLGRLSDGAGRLSDGAGRLSDGAGRLSDGASRLSDGTGELVDGTGRLSDGTGELVDGTDRLTDGTGELVDGTDRLTDGTDKLADGSTKLEAGTSELDSGAMRLEDGAAQLVQGLRDAGDGSARLSDGLKEADEGAPKISSGAQELHERGTSKLVDAGKQTAVDYGVKFAQLRIGSARARQEPMLVGAPQGAQGLTAYSFEVRGETGEEQRNWTRVFLAGGIFLLAGGASLLRRRLA